MTLAPPTLDPTGPDAADRATDLEAREISAWFGSTRCSTGCPCRWRPAGSPP